MNESKPAIIEFLADNGWQHATRTALAGDASSRRYERLRLAGDSAILMDSSSDSASFKTFIHVDRFLTDLGYSAPDIRAVDLDNHLLLLEDFGDELISGLISDKSGQEKYFSLAVDFLIDLASQAVLKDLPIFDDNNLRAQGQMFLDWYYPAATGHKLSSSAENEYQQVWQTLFSTMRVGPDIMVLRDFHAENIIFLENRKGLQCLGLLDFQDALQGPPLYDLVSLLEDVRRDMSDDIRQKLKDRYIEKSNIDRETAQAAYAILTVYRNLRIAGIFIRLSQSQDKSGYLQFLPRLWHSVETYLVHPELSRLNQWFDENLPKNARDNFLKDLLS